MTSLTTQRQSTVNLNEIVQYIGKADLFQFL